jgi:hypothetical protein
LATSSEGGHARREVEGVGVQRGGAVGGVEEQLTVGGGVGEGAELHDRVLGVPDPERRVAVAVGLLPREGRGRVAGTDQHVVFQAHDR